MERAALSIAAAVIDLFGPEEAADYILTDDDIEATEEWLGRPLGLPELGELGERVRQLCAAEAADLYGWC